MNFKSLSSPQIALIMKKGRVCHSDSFLLRTIEGLGDNKTTDSVFFLSCISSKKNLKNAVDRNRSRRIFREAFKQALFDINLEKTLIKNTYFVILIKKNTNKIIFSELVEEIRCFLLKNYIIKQ